MPFGLTRNTRPLLSSAPRIDELPEPATRLRTAEEALACTKCVLSPPAMLNDCQRMMLFALFVTVSEPPDVEKVAEPFVTVGPVGFASTPAQTIDGTISESSNRA